jgi:hypothetical protein
MSSDSYSRASSADSKEEEDPRASCIRKVANFSTLKAFHQVDKKSFDATVLEEHMSMASPKLVKLFEHIQALDEKDMAEEGKHFKHMIFTDIKQSTYGAKLLASAFVAKGFKPAFAVHGPGFGVLEEAELLESKGLNFAVLMSKSFYDRNMSVRFKKAVLGLYNKRPDNVQGDLCRFIILDQGFKEGIDLFDVKYVHLFEPLLVGADEKQAIGRGTRFCGQQGLVFHPRYGWPLYVYKYNVAIPEEVRRPFAGAKDLFQLYLQYANIDLRKITFAAELEKVAALAAVDYELTYPIHKYTMQLPPGRLSGGAELRKRVPKPPAEIMNYKTMQDYVMRYYKGFRYPEVKLENKCGVSGGSVCEMNGGLAVNSLPTSGGTPAPGKKPGTLIQFTPTQDFVRHFFQPSSAYKGILFWHTVGVGKTCSAIATATTSFEKEGYTILWVTRHTLKADIWKNMYQQICSAVIREEMEKTGAKVPTKVSNKWMDPISYKQFSNLLLKKNKYYEEVVARNGKADPLRKTLLIIDEAHKLYSPTTQGSEKPNMAILEEMIANSYEKSGKDSVRLIVMTGTPYTEDGMEMIKLLNLLRPRREALATAFEDFGDKYLDDTGSFTAAGKKKILNQLSGYISHVNRSQDARNFAYPVMEEVMVPMSTEAPKEKDNEIKKMREKVKDLKGKVKDEKGEAKGRIMECKGEQKTNLAVLKTKLKAEKAAAVEKCKELPVRERTGCKDRAAVTHAEELQRGTAMYEELFKECMSKVSNLEAMEEYDNEINELKQKIGTSRGIKREFNTDIKGLREELKELKAEYKALMEKKKAAKGKKDLLVELRKEIKEQKQKIKELAAQITKLGLEKKKFMLEEGSTKPFNLTQLKALKQKCFREKG